MQPATNRCGYKKMLQRPSTGTCVSFRPDQDSIETAWRSHERGSWMRCATVLRFCRKFVISDAVFHVQGNLGLRLFVESLFAFRTVPLHPTVPDHRVQAFGIIGAKHISFSTLLEWIHCFASHYRVFLRVLWIKISEASKRQWPDHLMATRPSFQDPWLSVP